MANSFLDLIKNRDNAELAQEGNAAFGLGVDPTSIPLQPGLTNKELAIPADYNQLAQDEANEQALVQPAQVNRAPASVPAVDSDSQSPAPAKTPGVAERLEQLMAERNKAFAEAESRQRTQELVGSLAGNIGNIVGGAQAMNTGASVTPAKTGFKGQDLTTGVDKQYKPELDAMMSQYKALQGANKPMTEYQRLMLAHMGKQLNQSALNSDRGMERFRGTDSRLRGNQEFKEEQADEYSDKQTGSLVGFDKTSRLLEDIEAKASSGKYDKYLGPYASKYENLKESNPLSAGMDQEFSAFQSDVTDSLSQYIKGLSGLTVSDKERQALETSMPKVGDKPQTFMSKLKATRARLNTMRDLEVKALADYQGKKGRTFSRGEASLGKTEAAPAYPKQVRNGKGEVATVSNAEEEKEAKAEGFN